MENPTRNLDKLEKLGKLFPSLNKELIEAIVNQENEIWKEVSKENMGKIKEFPKTSKFKKYKEKFDIMKTTEAEDKDDFEKLIEEFYEDESYTILKNYEIARKQIYKNDNKQKQIVKNIMNKEFYYRQSKLRRFIPIATKCTLKSTGNSTKEAEKAQSSKELKASPEETGKNKSTDIPLPQVSGEEPKPEGLYARLMRLDREDAQRREEKWKKEELEYNLQEKKKKEERLNKQKQKDIVNEGQRKRR
ncbi:hypothetical protein JTB14_020285 [Gonioctena quinquepunctata]|nr:hypothetical protein JTB14_020285 [Gonioctena quinquepunctata]